MILMIFAITIAFIIRSSSLIGWIPLAIAFIFSSNSYICIIYNILEILKGFIFVTIPLMFFSIGMDSYFYGKFTFPQFNFIYLNIFENLSANFGVESHLYYLNELKYFINYIDGDKLSLIGLCLLTISQMKGNLTS